MKLRLIVVLFFLVFCFCERLVAAQLRLELAQNFGAMGNGGREPEELSDLSAAKWSPEGTLTVVQLPAGYVGSVEDNRPPPGSIVLTYNSNNNSMIKSYTLKREPMTSQKVAEGAIDDLSTLWKGKPPEAFEEAVVDVVNTLAKWSSNRKHSNKIVEELFLRFGRAITVEESEEVGGKLLEVARYLQDGGNLRSLCSDVKVNSGDGKQALLIGLIELSKSVSKVEVNQQVGYDGRGSLTLQSSVDSSLRDSLVVKTYDELQDFQKNLLKRKNTAEYNCGQSKKDIARNKTLYLVGIHEKDVAVLQQIEKEISCVKDILREREQNSTKEMLVLEELTDQGKVSIPKVEQTSAAPVFILPNAEEREEGPISPSVVGQAKPMLAASDDHLPIMSISWNSSVALGFVLLLGGVLVYKLVLQHSFLKS